ncbi:MAG: hypothetical protein WCQ67_06700 [Treponema sp.]
MKKLGIVVSALLALTLVSCISTKGGTADERAIAAGIKAWNDREPEAAAAYWEDIEDAKVKKTYQNYITLYNAGVESLTKSDSIKSTNESKLLSVCNSALNSFLAIDEVLKLPPDVCEKGSNLTAGRITALLASESVSAAKKMYNNAVKVYGKSNALSIEGSEIDVVSSIVNKKIELNGKADQTAAMVNFDEKIASYDSILNDFTAAEKQLASDASNAGVAKKSGTVACLRNLKNAHQDVAIARASAIREEAYEYKDKIGEEFASAPANSGKNDKQYLKDILAHYETVKANIDKIYEELLVFAAKYPKDIGQDVIDDITQQKRDLEDKIAQVQREIRNIEEVESRGKIVMPVMIGLFNADPSSTAESKKSRPAKFSATKAKKDEYWWGMVSIPNKEMNDLVITLKDNRTVRVFSENTKSGKLIEKKNMKDLVNRGYKVGNSWPVLNAGSQLTSNKYFFEVQKGKTPDYEGEVVVYSSFIVRMR